MARLYKYLWTCCAVNTLAGCLSSFGRSWTLVCLGHECQCLGANEKCSFVHQNIVNSSAVAGITVWSKFPPIPTPLSERLTCHASHVLMMCRSLTLRSGHGTAYHASLMQSSRAAPCPPLDNIRVIVIVWRLRGNIIRTALCWIVWHNVHMLQHTYMSSSCRSDRLGLAHWDPYAVRRGGCLELYYCNMVEWFWCDSSLISTTSWFSSVLWHCWFGHLACKNCLQNDLWCVEWDIKPLHYYFCFPINLFASY